MLPNVNNREKVQLEKLGRELPYKMWGAIFRISWQPPVKTATEPNDIGSSGFTMEPTTDGNQEDTPDAQYFETRIPDPVDGYNYYIGLHEFGHMYSQSQNEIKAAQWAYEHALYWNDDMTRAALDGLNTYVRYGKISRETVDNWSKQLKKAA